MYGHMGHAMHTNPQNTYRSWAAPRVLCALPVPSLRPWHAEMVLLTSFLNLDRHSCSPCSITLFRGSPLALRCVVLFSVTQWYKPCLDRHAEDGDVSALKSCVDVLMYISCTRVLVLECCCKWKS